MFDFIAKVQPLKFFLSNVAAVPAQHNVANELFESAGNRAGLDPHHAAELRDAARAYLSVVR
jgi:regulator of sirC expression with transglutaminase-like and TPR domain